MHPDSNHTLRLTSHGVQETRALGRDIGAQLATGVILALTGDLGSGKTAFVQGLATGLQVPDAYYVTSPTYTLINEYPGRIALFHVDLYRIGDVEELEDTGLYDILPENNVTAIEWADRLPADFLTEYLAVHFEIVQDEIREITISAYGLAAQNLIQTIGILRRFRFR
jgi:tRNA threonylcarbamoyladenosine biosynthesis protein TsaE